MKRTGILIVLMLVCLLPMAGCAPATQTNSQEVQMFIAVNNSFAAVVQELTILRQYGAFNQAQIENIGKAIRQGQSCLNQWRKVLGDPTQPRYSGMDCVNSSISTLLIYANQGVQK